MTNPLQLLRDFRKWVAAKYRAWLADGEKDEPWYIFAHHLETIINIENKINEKNNIPKRPI